MPILAGVQANGVGVALFIGDAEHVLLSLSSQGNAAGTVKFMISNQKQKPDFASAQSPSNRWDYARVVDLEDGASIDGDTGFAFAGADDNRNLEVDINGAQWFCAIVSGYSAGSIFLDGVVKHMN